jgi:hypothetical protein
MQAEHGTRAPFSTPSGFHGTLLRSFPCTEASLRRRKWGAMKGPTRRPCVPRRAFPSRVRSSRENGVISNRDSCGRVTQCPIDRNMRWRHRRVQPRADSSAPATEAPSPSRAGGRRVAAAELDPRARARPPQRPYGHRQVRTGCHSLGSRGSRLRSTTRDS